MCGGTRRTNYRAIYPSWITTNIVRPIHQWTGIPMTLPGLVPPTISLPISHPSPGITGAGDSAFPMLSAASSIINRTLSDENKYKEVISEKGLECIETIVFHAKDHKDINYCVITREKFVEGEEIAKLPCSHIFKKEPIEIWLKEGGPTCPICRHKLDSKEIKKEISSSLDSSGNAISNHRMGDLRTMLINLIDNRIEEEEEYNIQRAIIASLQERPPNNNDEEDDFPPPAPASAPAHAPLPPPPPPAPLPPTPLPDCLPPEDTISADEWDEY